MNEETGPGVFNFFVTVGAWILFVYLIAKFYEIYKRSETKERIQEEQEEKARKERKRKSADTTEKPKAKRRTVRFEDAQPPEEDDYEDEEPKGTYVYDPKEHKVVFIPAE
jgi:hypothetical protein